MPLHVINHANSRWVSRQKFIDLANLLENDADSRFFERTSTLQDFYQLWQKRVQNQDLETETIKEEMNRVNPVFIPRNHKIEQVIEAGLKGDFSLFHEMNEVLKKPYEEQAVFSSYKLAPRPEQVVQATFCGDVVHPGSARLSSASLYSVFPSCAVSGLF